MHRLRILPAALLLLVPTLAAARVQNTAKPAPPLTGFRAEFFANLDEVEVKIVSLAESTPADKYSWRPAGDIRSISEVYMHIAGANYFLTTFVGAKVPSRSGDPEKTVTAKADVVAELKKSFLHLRAVVTAMSNTDLEKQVKMFGPTPTSYRNVLITALNHLHEHLGQSIAYARMNGVAPPWSR